MAEVDPDRGHDAWEDERHEMEILERHLAGGLAPDARAEARVEELDVLLSEGGRVLRCDECGSELVSATPGRLEHRPGGAHEYVATLVDDRKLGSFGTEGSDR